MLSPTSLPKYNPLKYYAASRLPNPQPPSDPVRQQQALLPELQPLTHLHRPARHPITVSSVFPGIHSPEGNTRNPVAGYWRAEGYPGVLQYEARRAG